MTQALDAPAYTIDPIVSGEGWAIQRVGPVVLGFWNAHLDEDRVHACRRLYRRARQEHGRFSVFSVFRANPWSANLAAGQSARALVVSMFREFDGAFDALICVMDGTGIQGSILRLGAAAIAPLVPRTVPITFPSSVDEGARIARRAGTFDLVDEATLRTHLHALKQHALASTPA